MKTSSAKAKGRKLQQWMRTLLIEKLESDLKSKVKVIKFTELANK